MIIGSGLLARAFAPYFGDTAHVCVYAAGVSNSGCTDLREFERERARLAAALDTYRTADRFLYFGTCSANDRTAPPSPYVAHKIRMEQVAAAHPGCLIVRLPQVAGRSENPHTLLNYIFHRVSRSERFQVWARARRNIIDIDDAARISAALVERGIRGEWIDVANPSDNAISEVVAVMAQVVGKPAICDLVDVGDAHSVDASEIEKIASHCGVTFGGTYLERVIGKYYGGRPPGA